MTLPALISTIKTNIEQGETAGRFYYIKAGHGLIALKKALPKTWEKIAATKIGIGLRQAQRYMSWARDEAKYEADQKRERQHDKTYKEKKRSDSRESRAQIPIPVKNGKIQYPTCNADPAALRRERFLNACASAENLASFESDINSLFGLPELADAAARVADVWNKVASDLRRQASGKVISHSQIAKTHIRPFRNS